MDKLAPTRSLHAHVLAHSQLPRRPFLLNDAEFRLAAQCERMRVDRNGSVVSLLLMRTGESDGDQSPEDHLESLLEGRLRLTDTPGRLKDGRIAILLPDTSVDGAWKVAEDISECFSPGPSRPECDVRVYPASGRDGGFDRIAQRSDNDRGSGSGNSRDVGDDLLLAQPIPLWKRAIDIFGGFAGLLGSSPIIAVAAVGIKLTSSGPVLFKQEREGLGGRLFTMYKLRTMTVDAEERLADLRAHSHQDGPAFKMKCDPRTTAIGRFLRWSSFDELPQFWNVLRGDMSLVGPRPLPTLESRSCEGWQRRRLDVTPGLTCFWQVDARGNVTFDEWVRMDLRYVRKKSFWQDLKVIVATVPSILFRRGMR